jgi:hypothetical protein
MEPELAVCCTRATQQFPVAAKGAKNGGGGAGVFALC